MKARLSLLVLSALAAIALSGCSGISEEQAKKVDLQATPKSASPKSSTPGTPEKQEATLQTKVA